MYEAELSPGSESPRDASARESPKPEAAKRPRPPLSPARLRKLKLARFRRFGALVLLVLPGVLAVVTDAARRGERIVHFESVYRFTYLAAFLESLLLWGGLLYAASRRRGRMRWVAAALFVIATTFAFGGQAYFYQQYHAYLNVDVSLFASNFMDSVVNQLFADINQPLDGFVGTGPGDNSPVDICIAVKSPE